MKDPICVCVTGAAGQIAYSLLYNIARGDIYGLDQPVILHLLDIPPFMEVARGVVMELEDCALPLLKGCKATADAKEAFTGASAAILVGAMPRKEGMERADLLKANAKIFKTQGEVINEVASKDIKVLVVGNPANTNCLICMTSAPTIPKENFSCMTRLDQNRARAQIAIKSGLRTDQVKRVVIWGNHSLTQYPDTSFALVTRDDGTVVDAVAATNDAEWLQGDFIKTVQSRGGAVIAARKLSSAMSAAKAIIDHMRDWIQGSPEGDYVSMGVHSTGAYGIEAGLIYSFPVVCKDGKYTIVEGLEISDFSRAKMDASATELSAEKETALKFIVE